MNGRRTAVTLVCWATALAFALPYLLIVTASFRPTRSIATDPLSPFGGGWSLDNFRQVLVDLDFVRIYSNSVLVTVAIVAAQLVLAIAAAFAISYLRPRFGGLVQATLLVVIAVPGPALAVPNYLTLNTLGALNSKPALILPFCASAVGAFVLIQQAKGVPESQLHASALFGLSRWEAFRHVVLPRIAPMAAAFGAFSFVTHWNSFFWPLVVLRDNTHATLPYAIAGYQKQVDGFPDWGPAMAAAALALLPLAVLLVLVQRYFAKTLVFGT